MAHTSVSDPFLDLVDAIEEHTQHQLALIECVRTLRTFLGPEWTTDATYHARSPGHTSPPERVAAPPPVQAPPLVQARPRELECVETPNDPAPKLLLRALRRDYDYFTELDEKLAQLRKDLTAQEVDGWPEASTN
jgi:hypothetical protein